MMKDVSWRLDLSGLEEPQSRRRNKLKQQIQEKIEL